MKVFTGNMLNEYLRENKLERSDIKTFTILQQNDTSLTFDPSNDFIHQIIQSDEVKN